MSDKRAKRSPFTTEIVMGDAIRAEGRELEPWVRVTSRVRRRASVGGDGVGGGGWGFVHMRPVAIVDRSGGGDQRLQVRSGAVGSIVCLPLILLAFPVAFLLIRLLLRSGDKTA